MQKIRILVLVLLLGWSGGLSAQEAGLQRFRQIRSNPKLQSQLSEIVEVALRRAFGDEAPLPVDLDEVFLAPLGVFVTAESGDEVRGCMGNLQPNKNSLAEEIIANLRLAFLLDPRHRPIRKEELKGMKIYLSTAGSPVAVQRFSALSPARDAILLKSGGKEAVVLPGEARTLRYLLVFAKTKAGVKKGDPFQIYRLPVETLPVRRQTAER